MKISKLWIFILLLISIILIQHFFYKSYLNNIDKDLTSLQGFTRVKIKTLPASDLYHTKIVYKTKIKPIFLDKLFQLDINKINNRYYYKATLNNEVYKEGEITIKEKSNPLFYNIRFYSEPSFSIGLKYKCLGLGIHFRKNISYYISYTSTFSF